MTRLIRKLIIPALIFSLGVGVGILSKEIEDLFHDDYMSVTVWDGHPKCVVWKVVVKSGGYIVEKKLGFDEKENYKNTINFYSPQGKRSTYDIAIHTEKCGTLIGEDRTAYPGQVVYEFVDEDKVKFEIRH